MRSLRQAAFILGLCVLMAAAISLAPAAAAAGPSALSDPLVVGSEGRTVFLMQKRLEDLGFYTFRATGIYGAITRNAVVAFQKANDIVSDGTVGDETYGLIFSSNARRPSVSNALRQEKGPRGQQSASIQTGLIVEWKGVDEQMKTGKSYTITDFYTQTTFEMSRTGGTGHADMECTTNADFSRFLSIFGGSVSWEKRPVLVRIGATQVAASLFGMPHGYVSIATSGMSGHACLYFKGSTLGEEGGPITDVEHEAMIRIAGGQEQ